MTDQEMDFVAEVSKREWKLVKGYVALMVQNDQQQLTRDFVEMFQTAEPSEAKKKLSARIFKVGTTKTADGGIIGIGNTVRVSNLPFNGKDVCLSRAATKCFSAWLVARGRRASERRLPPILSANLYVVRSNVLISRYTK